MVLRDDEIKELNERIQHEKGWEKPFTFDEADYIRDAVRHEMQADLYVMCNECKHYIKNINDEPCKSCSHSYTDKFERMNKR